MNNTLILLLFTLKDKNSPEVLKYINEYIKTNDPQEFQDKYFQNIWDLAFPGGVEEFQNMKINDLQRTIMDVLKENKPEKKMNSGSVVDLFIRNVGLLFNQMDFPQLIKLWDDFKNMNHKQDPFIEDSNLEYLQEVLSEKVSYFDLKQIKKSLSVETLDLNPKAHYLKGIVNALLRDPFKATKFSRKFYDISMQQLVPKKVNHSIMNTIQISMLMNYYDEALIALSEALRLSQTCSDELSINQCLLYLYEIAYKNQFEKSAVLLLEYAVNHSQNLPSIYKLQNALMYGQLIRYFRFNKSLLLKKNISWIDSAHQNYKKVLQSYDKKIDQSIGYYILGLAKDYGNQTVVDMALLQVQQLGQTDAMLILQLETLASYVLYNPTQYIKQLLELLSDVVNILDQTNLWILYVAYVMFVQFGDQLGQQWIQELAKQKLEILPDPFISQALNLSTAKDPRVKARQFLNNRADDVELIRLCKEFKLKNEFIQYRLIQINDLLGQGQKTKAELAIKQIKINNTNLYVQAQYWLTQGQIYQNITYYQNALKCAQDVGNTSLVRDIYYEMAMFYDAKANYEMSEKISESFLKVDRIIKSQIDVLRIYSIKDIGLLQYCIGYIHNLKLQ
ncbi:hypothetical protein pb186bvf_000475 [Paramecium bursaria]